MFHKASKWLVWNFKDLVLSNLNSCICKRKQNKLVQEDRIFSPLHFALQLHQNFICHNIIIHLEINVQYIRGVDVCGGEEELTRFSMLIKQVKKSLMLLFLFGSS